MRDNLAEVKNDVRETTEGVAELRRGQKSTEACFSFTISIVARILNIFLDQDTRDIINWLSTLDFSTRQSDFFRRQQEGTGEWLFQTNAFKEWLDGTERTLWCPGLRVILPFGSFDTVTLF